MQTDFSIKWHHKVIKSQAFEGYWKANKALVRQWRKLDVSARE